MAFSLLTMIDTQAQPRLSGARGTIDAASRPRDAARPDHGQRPRFSLDRQTERSSTNAPDPKTTKRARPVTDRDTASSASGTQPASVADDSRSDTALSPRASPRPQPATARDQQRLRAQAPGTRSDRAVEPADEAPGAEDAPGNALSASFETAAVELGEGEPVLSDDEATESGAATAFLSLALPPAAPAAPVPVSSSPNADAAPDAAIGKGVNPAPAPLAPQAAPSGQTDFEEAPAGTEGGSGKDASLSLTRDAAGLAGEKPKIESSSDPAALLAPAEERQAKAVSTPVPTKPASAQSAAAPPSPPVPLGSVPMTIGLRALGAASRFEIRLDPVELGRIDVALDIDRERGTVGARLVVERPETLALLQRDAGALQQALAQTGLDASPGIALSLGDGAARDGGNGRDGAARGDPTHRDAGQDQAERHAPGEILPSRMHRALGGLDIRI